LATLEGVLGVAAHLFSGPMFFSETWPPKLLISMGPTGESMRPLSALLILLLLSLSPQARADSPPQSNSLQTESVPALLDDMKKRRIRSGYITTAIGTSILVVPMLSHSSDHTSRIFFSLAGLTVLMSGVKSFGARSESERLISQMEDLRFTDKLSEEGERSLLREVADWSRSERFWGAGFTLVGGTVSVAEGFSSSDPVLKKFAIGLGGLSLFGGVMSLLHPGDAEKLADAPLPRFGWQLSPALFQAGGKTVPGSALALEI
jgi:hypothetical protein